MAIPESQLETWAKQGSVNQSSSTYASIKIALEDSKAIYKDKIFEVFLQGSYGNDTNIYAESDVDVVIKLDSIFRGDTDSLSSEGKNAYNNLSNATYDFKDFKKSVIIRLQNAFGKENVIEGSKAVHIKPSLSRRSADVVVAYQYRRYYNWPHGYTSGIVFPTQSSGEIINYPKKHSDNCTTKHQETDNNFKPMVRILKNIRSKLVEDGIITKNTAPSYFVEGLLYNVPNELLTGSYGNILVNILNWFHEVLDRTKLLCANEQYYLLRDGVLVCWSPTDAERFINEVIKLWNNW
ncbi:MAG: nucleotidyltransferase [Candidatus Omnitrophota bacterium]